MGIVGTWVLRTWRRYEPDGTIGYPFGKSPVGLLIYTPSGDMAVQMVEADRPKLDTDDALGGTTEERAGAYSTCLAYFGRYRLDGDSVVHELDGSLFPNWAGTSQVRPLVRDGRRLVLRVEDSGGKLTNEIEWERRDRLDAFVDASVRLTGFTRTELLGTCVAEEYTKTLEAMLPESILDALLEAINGLPLGAEHDSELSSKVFDHRDLAPVARSLIVLWYTGTWTELPADWRARNGSSSLDTTRVVSANGYLAGLQWKTVGAHAPGGDMQGFGAWALPPAGDIR